VKRLLIILSCILYASLAISQELASGLVLNAADSSAVEAAHVINLSNDEFAITTANGNFSITASRYDTLLFSHINFVSRQFMVTNLNPVAIALVPNKTQLDEVVVSNMPLNAKAFKKGIIEMGVIESPDFLQFGMKRARPKSKIPNIYNLDESNSLGFAILNPLQYTARKLSKDFQDKAKYYKLKAENERNISIDKKFNRTIVQNLTELEGDSLTAFIKFLAIDPGYVMRATDYEIAIYISDMLEKYKKKD